MTEYELYAGCCVNTLDGLKIMCLKHGTDFNKLNMLLSEHG